MIFLMTSLFVVLHALNDLIKTLIDCQLFDELSQEQVTSCPNYSPYFALSFISYASASSIPFFNPSSNFLCLYKQISSKSSILKYLYQIFNKGTIHWARLDLFYFIVELLVNLPINSYLLIIALICMYNLQIAQKIEYQQIQQQLSQRKHNKWLKRYHTQIKPKLLHHYDARIQSFLRQIEVQPADPDKIIKNVTNNHYPSFKFRIYATIGLKKQKQKSIAPYKQKSLSILRSSEYTPISNYQFRERQKEKQIKPKTNVKTMLFRKWNKSRHFGSTQQAEEQKKIHKISDSRIRLQNDNRSELTFPPQDNLSVRYSNNSQNENIEKQARQFEKNQEFIEKKKHYKYLANLQQVIKDPNSKKAIHHLLVKAGIHRPKFKTQYSQAEVDLFTLETGRTLKNTNDGKSLN